jgi:tetratricopeptide (TPR) repeat protein
VRTNYWPFGFAVAAVSLVLPWFDPVTTPRFSAFAFPLAHSAYLWPSHFVFFSYGTAMGVLLAFGVFAWWRNKGLTVLCVGALLIFGAITFFLQIWSWEPTWLRAALVGGEDFQHCYRFEVGYTIPNAVIASPAKGLFEPVERLSDRISAATSSLGVGWSFFLVGAIWVCGAGLRQMNNWARLTFVVPILIAVFGLLGLLQVWRPIAAERSLAAAEVAEAHGAFSNAESELRHAMNIDAWHRLQPRAFVQLGQLYQKMGLHDRPEIHLARAEALQSRGLVQEALWEYTRTADDAGDSQLRHVALEEKARLASHYADTLYRRGVIGDACHYWQISVEANPNLVNGFFGAGRAFYDMAAYPAAIKHFEVVFRKTSQMNLLSDTASYLGDCYYKLGEVDRARRYYMASRDWDDRLNFRALKTLTESYYK